METTLIHRLQDDIQKKLSDLKKFRRLLHAQPEIGYEEFNTAKRISSELQKIDGLEIREGVAGTGIVATLLPASGNPTEAILLRADMDALPIQEESEVPYKSTTPGVMHACGHDGHSTCLLGAAQVLSKHRDKLPSLVKFVFQPAEENGAGGKAMVESGVLHNPEVKACFGLHGFPNMALGSVGSRPGALLAGDASFKITVVGQRGHAAFPHLCIDPIVLAAQCVTQIQTLVSRCTDPLKSLVVSVTQISGGGNALNVIPERVELGGTIRAFDRELLRFTKERIGLLTRSTCEAFGASFEIEFQDGYPPVLNDQTCTATLRQALFENKVPCVVHEPEPVMGAEDFAYFAEKVPSTFWFVGLRPEGAGDEYPSLHSSRFDFNDDALPIGVLLHCLAAFSLDNI